MKKLVLAAALVLTATSAATAQIAYSPRGYDYGYDSYGSYDVAPGYYGAAPAFGYYDDRPQWGDSYRPRGGPGLRVGAGGAGIGTQR